MVSVVVARPESKPGCADSVSVSVIVPCRNERGTVAAVVERMPRLGRHTEILFCDDGSTDGTADEVRRAIARNPDRDIRLIDGPGRCKADNVWTGFRASRGDILIILDGDLTVMPEELPRFVLALTDGRAELVNGVRMVYPMQASAMRWNHVIGNRLMSAIYSYLLDHPVNDTLCGTKAIWRRDWQRIEAQLGSWGVQDRWGDHELLLGAARLQLAIVDVPVHYQERVYGVSKMIGATSNLFRMLRLCVAAGARLKAGS
jgi:glycosyltransferase involved in cell wall biosynthesis